MEAIDRETSALGRLKIQMLLAAASGFFVVSLIGVASADETPTSDPALPGTQLAPAVVVAAGADTIDTNAVTRVTAYQEAVTQSGTGFRVDDGRVATVAHALIDARGVGIGADDPQELVRIVGDGAAPIAIDPIHDLAAIEIDTALAGLPISPVDAIAGDSVALAGFPADGRLEVVAGEIVARTSGAGYGIDLPDVYVISAPVTRGWSGGPVVNGAGEVTAVVVAAETTSGVALAVPITYLPTP